MIKKLAALFILVFYISFFPTLVSYGSEKDSDFKLDQNTYKQSRQDYLDVLNKSRTAVCRNENSCQQIRNQVKFEAKKYLSASSNLIISYLDLIEDRLKLESYKSEEKEKFLSDISSWKSELRDKAEKIKELDTEGDIEKQSQELKLWWREKSLELKKTRGYVYTWRVSHSLDNFYNIVEKIEDCLSLLGDNYDIKELEKELVEIKSILSDVEKINKETMQEFSSMKNYGDDFSEIFLKIKESKLKIIQAQEKTSNLIKISQKKNLSEKKASNIILIRGEGKVVLSGDLSVSGNLGDSSNSGRIILNNFSDNLKFDSGENARKEDGGSAVFYSNIYQFSFSDTNIDVEIISRLIEIDVIVGGSAKIILSGDGLYKIGDENWADIPQKELEISL